jgi:inosine-uridine nucleoside N-ribohydrolase
LQTHSQLEISIKSGVDVALELIRAEEKRSITYIALGPLTNLALMLRKDPGIVRDRLGLVSCMGGALDVPGNTSPVAECRYSNCFVC